MSQMYCPECNSWENNIRETREHPTYNWIRRWRCCKGCDNVWTTMEMPEGDFDVGALD